MKTPLASALCATAVAALVFTAISEARLPSPIDRNDELLKRQGEFIRLPSGLRYKVITAGAGRTPKVTDTVRVHYRGRLLDGREFDSSYKRNAPTEFPVNSVIKGWVEALQLMQEGAKWILYIPPHLAYGERGAGGLIGPNETLIFEIELLKVK